MSLQLDDLITLKQVAARFPGRDGKRLHTGTIWRWCSRGVNVHGRRVVLESLRVGGRRFVTQEALTDFVEALSAKTADPGADSSAAVQKEQDRIQAECERLGL